MNYSPPQPANAPATDILAALESPATPGERAQTAAAKKPPPRPCRRTRAALIALCMGLVAPQHAMAFEVYEQILPRAQWPAHASGQNVLTLAAVRETLRRFVEDEKIAVIIRYPGGDPGQIWARQLRGWLVSFGVPGGYIEVQPGAGGADQLELVVLDRR